MTDDPVSRGIDREESKVPKRSIPRVMFRLLLIGLYVASVGLLIWLGWKNQDTLRIFLDQARWDRFGFAFVAYGISLGSTALGWVLIMRVLIPEVCVRQHLEIFLATLAARRLPGTVWYVGGRLLLYEKIGIARRLVLFGSSIEWVLQTVSAGFCGLILLLVSQKEVSNTFLVILIIAIVSGMVLLHPKLLLRLLVWKGGGDTVASINLQYRDILGWLISYFLMWLSGGGIVTAFVSILQPLTIMDFFYISGAFSIGGVAGLLVLVFPSSFGAADLTLAALLLRMLPLPFAGAIVILLRLFTLALEFALAILCAPLLLRKYY